MRKVFCLIFVTILFIACKKDYKPENKMPVNLTAEAIVDSSISVHGGTLYMNSEKRFDFRGKTYIGAHTKRSYTLHRMYSDSLGDHEAIISSSGLHVLLNNQSIPIQDSLVNRIKNAVNSVHYFAYLPYGLNDKAVEKSLLGEEVINNTTYYKLKITFKEAGGGDDFEDVFIYWIDKDDFYVDYLAYEYHTGKGGMRFRAAYNRRNVNGIYFQDYKNYKPANGAATLETLGKLYEKNELELLSTIALEAISVTPIIE